MLRKDGVQAADVVGMGMGADDQVQILHAYFIQISVDCRPLVVFPGVDQDIIPIAAEKHTVPLAHVNIMDGKPRLPGKGVCKGRLLVLAGQFLPNLLEHSGSLVQLGKVLAQV